MMMLPLQAPLHGGTQLASYPGPLRGEEKRPGIYCVRMCIITPTFRENWILLESIRVMWRHVRQLHVRSISYALKQSISSGLILYWDQLATIQGSTMGMTPLFGCWQALEKSLYYKVFPVLCVSTGHNSLLQSSVRIVLLPLVLFLST